MQKTWEHVSLHLHQRKYKSTSSSRAWCQPRKLAQHTRQIATHCRVPRPNHSVMTHRSNADWHQPYWITHSEQQRGGNNFPLGCSHLTLANRYWFCMEETCEHISAHWQQGKYQLWANCVTCLMPASNAGPRFSVAPPTTAVSSVLTKRDDFPLGCFNLAVAYWYYFVLRGHIHICIYMYGLPIIVA